MDRVASAKRRAFDAEPAIFEVFTRVIWLSEWVGSPVAGSIGHIWHEVDIAIRPISFPSLDSTARGNPQRVGAEMPLEAARY
jgi:hypothetical protein